MPRPYEVHIREGLRLRVRVPPPSYEHTHVTPTKILRAGLSGIWFMKGEAFYRKLKQASELRRKK